MKRLLVFILVAAFCMVLLIVLHGTEREPRYDGYPLSSWILEYEGSGFGPGSFESRQAEEERIFNAIRKMGTNCVPQLLEWLAADDGPVRARLVSWVGQHRVIGISVFSSDKKQDLAIRGFEILGPIATPAVPKLIEMLKETNLTIQIRTMIALGDIGPNAKDARSLIETFIHTHPPGDCGAATNALAEIASTNRFASP